MEIPGFEIKRTIGRGGMATVFLAIQKSLEREVVIKCLNTDHEDESGDFLERFMKEGRIIASLRHPHIVTIYDIGSHGDYVYIAMEYVDGGDLRAKIENRLAPVRALDIVSKVGQALEYAHKKGIIHRDVKPANILFRSDGTPLLSDFGIAKDYSSDNELTSTGTILGSPFYMSPEQAEGIRTDGRTDIYSLGVIFYEMLTGQKPYEGESAIKVIMQHIQSPVPQLPLELEQFQPLLNRLMAKDRDQRIADAAQLLEEVAALREEVEGKKGRSAMTLHTLKLPLSAKAMRARRDAVTGRSQKRLRLAALAGAMLLTVGGLGAYILAGINEPPPLVVHIPPQGATPAAGTNGSPRGRVANGGPVDKQEAARALEWLARNSLSQDRLMSPPADNAHYYFSRLLELNPNNEAARQGFSAIAERFVVLAEEEFSRKNYAKAQAYITLGLQVQPDNRGLETLRSMIETREKTFFETVAEYFRSS
jgi:tRNA A-37 threonylcarbamoyl transferase component Bud32